MSEIVSEREAHYGPCTVNHPRTQTLWCAYLEMLPGQPTAVDVCVLNILQKLARAVHDPTYEDNWIDIQGYAENILTLVRTDRYTDPMTDGCEHCRECDECGASLEPDEDDCRECREIERERFEDMVVDDRRLGY